MKKILIVDDDKFISKAYQVKLKDEGHEIKVVANGQEAIEALKDFIPNLVILDLIMPIKDGFTFLKEMRAKPEWKDIPVAVVTNLSDESDEETVKKLGANVFINKASISLDQLEERVKALLEDPKSL